jgi:hypothetical protein
MPDHVLRLLACGALLTAGALAFLIVPDSPSYARLQPLVQSALTSTTGLLTSAAGVVALVLTGLRCQRVWFVVFLLLVVTSSYSPVLHMQDADVARQFDVTPFFLYSLSEQVLPAAMVAPVAVSYSVLPRAAGDRVQLKWAQSRHSARIRIDHPQHSTDGVVEGRRRAEGSREG